MFQSLKEFWSINDRHTKIVFISISILMIFGSFAELMSIGAIFPFIAFLTSPEIILESSFADRFPSIFENYSEKDLLFFCCVIFIFLTLFSGAIRLLVLYSTTRFSLNTGMKINKNLFKKTLYQPYLEHTKSNSSETISALTTKSNAVCFNILIPIK